MNNFCIALCLLSATKLLERYQEELGAFILSENLASMFFVFTPSVGVEHFWVDLDGKHVFAPTSSVGVVHIWVVRT